VAARPAGGLVTADRDYECGVRLALRGGFAGDEIPKPVANLGQKSLDGVGRPVGQEFDPAVRQVPHPAAYRRVTPRDPDGSCPEPDPLNMPRVVNEFGHACTARPSRHPAPPRSDHRGSLTVRAAVCCCYFLSGWRPKIAAVGPAAVKDTGNDPIVPLSLADSCDQPSDLLGYAGLILPVTHTLNRDTIRIVAPGCDR